MLMVSVAIHHLGVMAAHLLVLDHDHHCALHSSVVVAQLQAGEVAPSWLDELLSHFVCQTGRDCHHVRVGMLYHWETD